MGFKDKMQARADASAEGHRAKALENLTKRRDWVVTKMATNVSLTGQAFDNDLSKLAQELFYLDAAVKSLGE